MFFFFLFMLYSRCRLERRHETVQVIVQYCMRHPPSFVNYFGQLCLSLITLCDILTARTFWLTTLFSKCVAAALKILHIDFFLMTVHVQYVFGCCVIIYCIFLYACVCVCVPGSFIITATPGKSSHWVCGRTVRERRSWKGYVTVFWSSGAWAVKKKNLWAAKH